jgi:putative spermidine/putrescine transport system permease protein
MTRLGSLAMLALVLFLVLPLVPLGLWSGAKSWFFPDILPSRWSGEAWAATVSPASGVPQALWTSTLVALLTTALSVIVGLPAARALGRGKFRGKALAELVILAPVIVPGIAVVLGLHTLFTWAGLANTLAGVVLVHLIPTLPYMILVLAGVFANLDPNLEGQARTLGAGRVQTFVYVTLPAILPGLVTGALFAFLVSWSQYILTLVIGGGRVVTLPLLLFSYASAGRNDLTGAIGLIYILPGVLVLILTARVVTGRGAGLAGFGRL